MDLSRPGYVTNQSTGIVTADARMQTVIARAEIAARSNAAVLLIGETGVGKELFAEHIHRMSPRSLGPFVAIALSALPNELIESELFGHERGAFTSAHAEKSGLFELAHGGTVFLDDVDDAPITTQAKLLRVLETKRVQRLGAAASVPVDVRLVAATKVDLRSLIENGRFRPDLYYRLNVCPLEIPPLRERIEDIPLLLEHFLRCFSPDSSLTLVPESEAALRSYEWPGNVRELRNVAQRITLFATSKIRVEDLPVEIALSRSVTAFAKRCGRCCGARGLRYVEVLESVETHLLTQALVDAGGNVSRAARTLGLSLSTLRDNMRRLHIDAQRSSVDFREPTHAEDVKRRQGPKSSRQ